jgi:urease accessory protein
MIVMEDRRLMRLLQLASPTLPVGGFSYSQGLESVVEAGGVTDRITAERWIHDVLHFSLATLDAPMLDRLIQAWTGQDTVAVAHWNARYLASRETAEQRAETVQMGFSLRQLAKDLEPGPLDDFLLETEELAYPTLFAYVACKWSIARREAICGYLWSWLENQVMAAIKAVPVGQTDGQRLLFSLAARIDPLADAAMQCADEDIANFCPRLALLSSLHETQYSRIFRS